LMGSSWDKCSWSMSSCILRQCISIQKVNNFGCFYLFVWKKVYFVIEGIDEVAIICCTASSIIIYLVHNSLKSYVGFSYYIAGLN
jgi:hypothetical protein